MSETRKPLALLPSDHEHDGPLFFVIAIIVFLASMAAISSFVAVQNVAHWRQALQSEMTVQIKSGDMAETKRAARIIGKLAGVKIARAGSRAEAKALLEPWLGAENIPDDLPIPLLVYVSLKNFDPPDAARLATALANAGIDASVDDHQRWVKNLARSARAVQILSIAVLALLVTASIAITGFATRAGLATRRDLVEVLHLVGARDRVIARLFGRRFVMLGLKAGVLGAVLAGFSLTILLASGVGASSFLGGAVQPGLQHLWLLLPVPILTAIVGGWTAMWSVMHSLRKKT
ncbi:Cell-division-associated, ABC-transporter-like signaling protein FtsX [hydrothermal vent metagenome]|uniref:Cell-division-associated, ABC-transporter-like signaling protein FtsX n=1 Tax=hydrothermal vent metagenome TaxID=652676 RepID=A0A3B0RT42_9ZZZZ